MMKTGPLQRKKKKRSGEKRGCVKPLNRRGGKQAVERTLKLTGKETLRKVKGGRRKETKKIFPEKNRTTTERGSVEPHGAEK